MSDRDFGRYNCTARNNIGVRYQEFILAQAGECASAIVWPELTRLAFSFQVLNVWSQLLNHRAHTNPNCSTAL